MADTPTPLNTKLPSGQMASDVNTINDPKGEYKGKMDRLAVILQGLIGAR